MSLGFVVWFWDLLPDSLINKDTSTVLYSNEGVMLGASIADDGQWRFPLGDSVPVKFEKCLLTFEDKHFYWHPGINPLSVARAALQNMRSRSVVSGASTLTMQLARLSEGTTSRTLLKKFKEMFMALRIEIQYSKQSILNFYVGKAPFGGNVVGLEAASWRYFGVSPHKLSWAESATLAVLPNQPSLIYPGKNQQRLKAKRDRLLKRLYRNGDIGKITCSLAIEEPLPKKPHSVPHRADHYLSTLQRTNNKGNVVRSSISSNLQSRALGVINAHYQVLKRQQIHNAACLIIDHQDNKMLAYVGNTTSPDEHSPKVDVIQCQRSTGSLLKPFLYALALDDGLILPSSLIPDVPTFYDGFTPKNFSGQYDGAVPADRALVRSLNIPFVQLLREYNYSRFHSKLKQIGFTSLFEDPDHYGLSIILGGSEASMWELSMAYYGYIRQMNGIRPLKLLGYLPTHLNDQGEYPISVESSRLTTHVLRDVERPEEESHWRKFSSSREISWKTGTSFGFRDAWAIGYSGRYLISVWVGNADGEGRPGLVGSKIAGPILFELFDLLPDNLEDFRPPIDTRLREVEVCQESGFIKGPYCENVSIEWLPISALKTPTCPYHHQVMLDRSGERVNSNCESVHQMKAHVIFELPPTMALYYRKRNPGYSGIPPFRADCAPSNVRAKMEFIYPRDFSKIYIPRELDGTKGRVVFHLAYSGTENVYWHLNEVFYGVTKDDHQMALDLSVGEYFLTVVDGNGERLKRKISIISD